MRSTAAVAAASAVAKIIIYPILDIMVEKPPYISIVMFTAEVRLVAGREAFGLELARLLFYIGSVNSLKEAARLAGLPYTTAWNLLARAERALGTRLVAASRKRGASLTGEGRRILYAFLSEAGRRGIFLRIGRLVYAGSHDPALEEGLPGDVEAYFVGSLRGLLAVASGDADFGGLHLGNNADAVRTYAPHLALISGYRREVGIAYRRGVDLGDLRGLRLVNRQPGSGSRMAIDSMLKSRGLRPEEVAGYDYVAATHGEAAEAVAKGIGDYTVTVRYAAERHGLRFAKLFEEDFDFVARRERAEEAADIVRRVALPAGYTAKPDMGAVRPAASGQE